jgi:hypothetical protein
MVDPTYDHTNQSLQWEDFVGDAGTFYTKHQLEVDWKVSDFSPWVSWRAVHF